jgi:hypothetical protein
LSTIAGREVWSGSFDAAAGESVALIPLTGIRTGLYLLSAMTEEGMLLGVKKLVRK